MILWDVAPRADNNISVGVTGGGGRMDGGSREIGANQLSLLIGGNLKRYNRDSFLVRGSPRQDIKKTNGFFANQCFDVKGVPR